MSFASLLTIIVSGLLGAAGTYFGFSKKNFVDKEKAELEAERLILVAKEEATKLMGEARLYVEKGRGALEHFSNRKEEFISKTNDSLLKKEENLNKKQTKIKALEEKKQEFTAIFEKINLENGKYDGLIIEKLAEKTGTKSENVKQEAIEAFEKELIQAHKDRLTRHEDYLKENAEKVAKRELVDVIQGLCSSTSVERRAANVKVPKDHIKERIFGENGKNIRLIEDHFGVDIIFNDLPQTISLSAFSLVQRRAAQLTIEKLVDYKGEITPEVIKNQIEAASSLLDKELFVLGKRAINRMGISHENEKFIKTVGRLQYRTSYGQNVMLHSMEVGWVCRMLGERLGLTQKTCLVGGFLHDVGKAIDQDPNQKDCHDLLSKEIMEEAGGFSWEEIHAAWVHHDAIPQETAEAHLVKAADAVSASRPGARAESFDKYIERIHDLEAAAFSFDTVKQAYALAAGRELRVLVDPRRTDDDSIQKLAETLAEKIEKEITYPGQVRVNVIRRTEFTNSPKKNDRKPAAKK